MAIIKLYTRKPASEGFDLKEINHDGSLLSWINDNIQHGQNIQVYSGKIAGEFEISRDIEKMSKAEDVSIFIAPSGLLAGALIVSLVVSVGVALLAPKPQALSNVNRQQSSKNNSLSDRKNQARPNERIVDFGGRNKSIPDIIQKEFARYVNNIEERVGCYVFGRNQVSVTQVQDGDSLIGDTLGSSAGIYYPYKSPNNSTPDVQIGDAINEKVVGVYQSGDAIGQTLRAPNEGSYIVTDTTNAYPDGSLNRTGAAYDESFSVGDIIELSDFWYGDIVGGVVKFGQNTSKVISVSRNIIKFDITNDTSWDSISPSGSKVLTSDYDPVIVSRDSKVIGPFDIKTVKVDRLLVNVYAPNGMYRDTGSNRVKASADFVVKYQLLNDAGEPIGSEMTTGFTTVSGIDSNEKGATREIPLGSTTFVRWSVERVSDKDLTSQGSILDEIKLKDVFGLFDVDKAHFGNVTMIQTKRTASSQTTAITDPQVNAICTEMLYKYSNGSFATTLTENQQAMQTLISKALDPRIGRRQASELDLPLLESIQTEIETYYGNEKAGRFSYSFDSADITAEETFITIANSVSCTTWREGRVLKAWFEKPQTVPERVFTHRSKVPNSETWTRRTAAKETKDSIEFKYIDEDLYTQEIIYIPADRSGTNPKTVEIPGIRGLEQATWRANREFNKLKYQEIGVDFTATAEGRFVKPNRMISVVKGTRVGSYDGYIMAQDGLKIELSQEVEFTANDDHFIVLKKRDGTTESIAVTSAGSSRLLNLAYAPAEAIYTGNSELKTEFSFGNEARLMGDLVLPQDIDASEKYSTKIKAINYTPLYYKDDPAQPATAFSDGFSDGFS